VTFAASNVSIVDILGKLMNYQPVRSQRDPMREIDAFYASLGATIRQRREAANMTQEALGKHLSLSRTSITNIERGRQRLLADQLRAVSEALQVPCDDLLSNAAKPSRPQRRPQLRKMPTVAEFVEKALDELMV
jgi:transcriptional regulator with XRE-family HTH domain